MQLFVFPRNGWPWNIFWSNKGEIVSLKDDKRENEYRFMQKELCFIACHILDWKTVNSLSLKI